MKEEKAGLLVEGYLDMISLYQAGFRHAAASLGTALTEKQIHLLKRFCNQIHLFYDRDAAGEAATIRNIEKMFEQNVNPRIVVIEGAKDPDEFVRAKGAPALREALLQHRGRLQLLAEQGRPRVRPLRPGRQAPRAGPGHGRHRQDRRPHHPR